MRFFHFQEATVPNKDACDPCQDVYIKPPSRPSVLLPYNTSALLYEFSKLENKVVITGVSIYFWKSLTLKFRFPASQLTQRLLLCLKVSVRFFSTARLFSLFHHGPLLSASKTPKERTMAINSSEYRPEHLLSLSQNKCLRSPKLQRLIPMHAPFFLHQRHELYYLCHA